MRLSLNWLKEFIEFKLSPEKLAEKLTLAGFEVEKIEAIGKRVQNIVIGEILEIKKHPKADRLQMVKVKTKQGIKNIVCGASNIKEGQKVPLALPGAKLSAKFNGLVIQKSEIRGVISEGMLCAEDELGIGEDHSGIYILKPEVKITDDLKEILGFNDFVLEINVTPNRGDCLSVLGLAREVEAILNQKMTASLSSRAKRGIPSQLMGLLCSFQSLAMTSLNNLKVEVKDFNLCQKYTAAVVKGVKVKESPEWMKARLRNSGIRPINNIVDITNYVMLELGQSLHAFDFDKLIGGEKKLARIIIRPAKNGEKIITIDNKERDLDESILVIANSKKPVALAGVMGGKESEISETTKDIILESAQFNPISIRQTSRKLGLRSDSSMRFERGIDWNITEIALERAIELIKEFSDGKEEGRLSITKKPIYLRRVIKISPNFISDLLGVKISKEKIKNIFLSLDLKVAEYYNFTDLLKPEIQKKIIEEAEKLLGKPYKYGAKESEAPKYFDCSSLVQYLYKKVGIIIPRCSIDQAEVGEEIKKSDLQLGDLIFTGGKNVPPPVHYNLNFPEGIDHVALYLGKNKVIYAHRNRKRVIKEDLKEFLKKKKWMTAKRIINQKIEELIVTIPSWREDLQIKEDLAEEVGRIYDYNKMKPTFIKAELKPVFPEKDLLLENKIKDILIALGFDEVYNYSFYGEEKKTKEEHLKIINPLNPDQEFLRTTLKPKIEENLEKNLKFFDQVKIFEIGNVFLPQEGKIIEKKKIIVAVAIKNPSGLEIFKKLKGALELLFEKLNIKKEIKFQEKGKVEIRIENKLLGDLEINDNSGSWELDFDLLMVLSQEKVTFKGVSIFPPVLRDLAIMVDKNTPFIEIYKSICSSPFVQQVELFDLFESKKLGEGKKSLAFHIVFQSFEKTLKAEEVEEEVKKILYLLEKKFSAKLRDI